VTQLVVLSDKTENGAVQ